MHYLAVLITVVSLALTGCEQKQQVVELGMSTLEKDTTWEGTVIINGDVYVPPGVTLTIKPGTTVKFKRIDETSDQNMFGIVSPYYPEAELIIRGKIIAKGTSKEAIVFTSKEIDARPKDWGAVNLLGSEGNIFDYCKMLFAYNGIHGHGAEAVITNSEFAKNGVGVSFKMEEETLDAPWFGKISVMKITHSKFFNNKGAIGLRNSKGEISHNLIEDNKFFGIFPKEKAEATISYNQITGNKKGIYLYQAQKVIIEHNNIYDNVDYNVAVAEAQDFEVIIPNNWFGTINEKNIDEKIFDKKDDGDLGEVLYKPFLKKRVAWE
nr:right-handed parallel beta-helix repeat-containing protein [Desulfobulbaceae bacterium]